MFYTVSGETANEAWLQAVALLKSEAVAGQASRAGETSEVLHVAVTVRNARQRWVRSRSPALNPAFAVAEVVWIMRGRKDSAFLTYFNSQLPKYSGNAINLHGAYGHRLRNHLGVDQLEIAYQTLKNRPESRQVVLQFWDGRIDLPLEDGQPAAPDIPCNIASILKVRDNKLEWTQIMRSNDLSLGLPYNIVQFTSLQEILAGWLGIEPADYHHYADSLHVYQSADQEFAPIHPVSEIPNTDNLAVNKDVSEQGFTILESFVESIIDESKITSRIMAELDALALPSAFRNMASLLAAEGLRRRREPQLMKQAIESCSNPAYRQMFQRWLERLLGPSNISEEPRDE